MQTFTMQFPASSTVTIGVDGTVTITPSTPSPTVSDPSPTVPDFNQAPNLRAYRTFSTNPPQPVVPVIPAPAKALDIIDAVEQLANWIDRHVTGKVCVDYSANELRYKYKFSTPGVWVIGKHGVTPWTVGDVDSPIKHRIAVVCIDEYSGVTYVAPYSHTLKNNSRYLADALRGGRYSVKILTKILSTVGRHASCPGSCALTQRAAAAAVYTSLSDYLSSLDIKAVDTTTYTPISMKVLIGGKYNEVDGLVLLTTEGVCPWVSTLPNGVARVAMLYLDPKSKTMYIARYSNADVNQYIDCVKQVTSYIHSAE